MLQHSQAWQSFLLLQGEKLSSTLIFAVLQVAAGLLLGIHLPADLAQLVIFLPNSRYQVSPALSKMSRTH